MSRSIILLLFAFISLAIAETSRGQDAAAATDPSVPLTQLQIQNIFIPESFDSTGYSNQFIVQPVLPLNIGEDAFFPYHIIRPTIPVIAPTPDPIGPLGVQGGLGDTTVLDVFVHPIEELKTNWGLGYSAVLPTATHEGLGTREWKLGPSIFVTSTAVDKWLFGVLYYQPFSLQTDKYQVLMQPIATRFLPEQFYIGWGDMLWKLNDEEGDYDIPLNFRFGKVASIGKHKLNIFVEPYYTPEGLHRTSNPTPRARAGGGSGRNSWGIKLNVTFLLPKAKLRAPLLSHVCGQ